MHIKPLFDRVVVKPIAITNEKQGNIILPELTNKPELSEVVALGKSSSDPNYQFTVKIGDKVLFNKYAGSDFVINGEHFTIIKEIDILGIVER